MLCACHGEPAYWARDGRYVAGGFWRCAVRKRAQSRDIYDRDPVHRIEKNLKASARKRRSRLERRRLVITKERLTDGPV